MPLDEDKNQEENKDEAKKEEGSAKEGLSDDDIEKLAEALASGDTSSKEFQEFERKLNLLQKKHRQKHIFRTIGIKLLYVLMLFAVHLAAFGFLSSYITIYSWQKALIYLGSVTLISIIIQIIVHFIYLIPGTFTGIRPYIIQLSKPAILFIIMLIANYNLKLVVFDHWYDIILFEIISYAFQFGITYYKYKGFIRKLL